MCRKVLGAPTSTCAAWCPPNDSLSGCHFSPLFMDGGPEGEETCSNWWKAELGSGGKEDVHRVG